MNSHVRWFIFVILLTAFAVWVALPGAPQLQLGENADGSPNLFPPADYSLGLDLVGGLRVLLEAELPPDAYTVDDIRETANNVARRVNALGLTEPTIQIQGQSRILVELPGETDREQALSTIQQTALLEFVDFAGLNGQQWHNCDILTTGQLELQTTSGLDVNDLTAGAIASTPNGACIDNSIADADALENEPTFVNPSTGQPFETVMTGAGLQAAVAQYGPTDNTGIPHWHISFSIAPEFVETFGTYTAARVGQPMAIVLDGEVLSAPVINSRLDTGGIITFSDLPQAGETEFAATQRVENEVRTLALQLRSGALPIPLAVVSAEEVGATLGQESVNLSVRAGVIGVIVVLTFMLVYYRVPGIAADCALIIFIILNLAVFKLLPVTLTLPAITGFLISIGTAVDGNILIFERIKEELRSGTPLDNALVAGFDRAWTSIRDSNFSTIIICGILFFFGQTPGASIVSGFAVTLAIGLILNLFTAVIVTRTFLYMLVMILRQSLVQRRWLLGV